MRIFLKIDLLFFLFAPLICSGQKTEYEASLKRIKYVNEKTNAIRYIYVDTLENSIIYTAGRNKFIVEYNDLHLMSSLKLLHNNKIKLAEIYSYNQHNQLIKFTRKDFVKLYFIIPLKPFLSIDFIRNDSGLIKIIQSNKFKDIRFEYYSSNLIKILEFKGKKATFHYDGGNNLTEMDDPSNRNKMWRKLRTVNQYLRMSCEFNTRTIEYILPGLNKITWKFK